MKSSRSIWSVRRSVHAVRLLTAAALAAVASPTRAAVYEWTGATDTAFGTADNWLVAGDVPAAAPTNNVSIDSAAFIGSASANQPVMANANFQLRGLDFQSAGWTFTAPPIDNATVRTLTLGVDGIDSAGAGTNVVAGRVAQSSSNAATWTIGQGNTLELTGILTTNGNITKDGAGTLRLSGTSVNSGGMTVSAGLLELNKTGGVAALTGVSTVTNATVKWLGNGQVSTGTGGTQFVVGAGGLLDLNNFNSNFAYSGNERLILSGGTIQTGTATWTFSGNNAQAAVINGSTVSTITGTTDLGSNDRGTAVSDNAAGVDFNWAAKITDASSGVTARGLSFTAGSGTPEVILSGENDYRGSTSVGANVTVYLDHANSLGATSGSTNVSAGGTVALRGGRTYAGESLTLAYSSTPGLRSVSGNNTWTGTITNTGGSSSTPNTVRVDADILTVTGSLSAYTSSRQLGKTGAGTLVYDNAASNTTANLHINDGTFAFAPTGEVNVRGGNTILNGGVVAAPDNMTTGLGTGSNTTRFGGGGGGWAAFGADINVDVASLSTLTWGGSTASQNPLLTQSGGVVTVAQNVYYGGAGYTGSETVTISGGGGSGATGAITVVNGVVTNFTITNGGSGYTSNPTATIGAPTSDGGTAHFLANGAPMILNSIHSAHKVTLLDNLKLAAASAAFTGQREIRVLDNPNSTADRGVIAGVISSDKSGIGLTKTGAGTLELSNANTYDGPTSINAGALLVTNASGSGTGSGTVTVGVAGTLGGTGSVGGAATVHGRISAGVNGVGTLSTGNLVVSDSGWIAADVNTVNNTADRIKVAGTVDLTDADLIIDANGVIGSYSQTLVLLENDSDDAIVGSFAGMTRDENDLADFTANNLSYTVNYAYNADGGSVGNDLAVTFTAVPEPGSLSLLGLAGAAILRRKRRVPGNCLVL